MAACRAHTAEPQIDLAPCPRPCTGASAPRHRRPRSQRPAPLNDAPLKNPASAPRTARHIPDAPAGAPPAQNVAPPSSHSSVNAVPGGRYPCDSAPYPVFSLGADSPSSAITS